MVAMAAPIVLFVVFDFAMVIVAAVTAGTSITPIAAILCHDVAQQAAGGRSTQRYKRIAFGQDRAGQTAQSGTNNRISRF